GVSTAAQLPERDASDLPSIGIRTRRGRRAVGGVPALPARARCRRGAAGLAASGDRRGRDRCPGGLFGRNAVSVRARTAVLNRRTLAGAQRGRGGALDISAVEL